MSKAVRTEPAMYPFAVDARSEVIEPWPEISSPLDRPGIACRQVRARYWLDGAVRDLGKVSGPTVSPAALDAALTLIIERAERAGLAIAISTGHREKLADQIATWYARRGQAEAQDLMRSALVSLII